MCKHFAGSKLFVIGRMQQTSALSCEHSQAHLENLYTLVTSLMWPLSDTTIVSIRKAR